MRYKVNWRPGKSIKVRKKAKIRNGYNQVPHLTLDTTWESDKNTTLLYVHFSIAIILMGKRELIALLNLSSWCLVMVERLFLTVPPGCLQFVIVVFPDHTHLLFIQESQEVSPFPAGDHKAAMNRQSK